MLMSVHGFEWNAGGVGAARRAPPSYGDEFRARPTVCAFLGHWDNQAPRRHPHQGPTRMGRVSGLWKTGVSGRHERLEGEQSIAMNLFFGRSTQF